MPQLARLMGRSEHAARWLRARWQRAGWVEGRQLLVGAPVFVWLTRDGARLADSPHKPWKPNPGALAHIAALSDVRLWLVGRRPDAEWVSERALLREHRGRGRANLPDALVRAEGQEVPVEVELTLKKRERLDAIISGHLAAHPAVWYFAAPGPRRALEEIARRLVKAALACLSW
jgi:hypothetical protein